MWLQWKTYLDKERETPLVLRVMQNLMAYYNCLSKIECTNQANMFRRKQFHFLRAFGAMETHWLICTLVILNRCNPSNKCGITLDNGVPLSIAQELYILETLSLPFFSLGN